MPNRLSGEKSPYLLQHAENPVDWYPWGEEAFRKARDEDKAIFLSIGYATCHWCHVMEHESFEDDEVARLLNEHFVAVKVDREERPDLDQIYMSVCQVLTGSGGWPLSIFMTPERKPFFAGTYFPKTGRMGMPGMTDLIAHIAGLWENHRERVFKASEEITGAIQPRRRNPDEAEMLDRKTLDKAYQQLARSFDPTMGGFGGPPKFPTPHHLTFMLRFHRQKPHMDALSMVEKTLDAMRDGGMFDQIGFGFHRYSVDERWVVPHFEKMLYDQAMLAMAYTEAFQMTGKPSYAQVTREIFTYVLRDMTDSDGAFYSAEDADSEGEEGLFYVWTPEEVKKVLGRDQGELFCRFHDITPEGNFEGRRSIPHITKSTTLFAQQLGMAGEELEDLLEAGRRELFAAREKRPHPFKDDKILTSWNGLMIAALAKGYQALGDTAYLQAAIRATDFLLRTLRTDSGDLLRRYRHGQVAHAGYLDDHAFLTWGLLELYEASFDVRYLEQALRIQEQTMDRFWDELDGGFFYTARDGENLIVRDKDIYDSAIPSGNSVAALNLLRLSRMTGDPRWDKSAERLLKNFSSLVGDYPSAYTQFLNALDFALGPGQEIVIAGESGQDETRAMTEILHRKFAPNRVLMLKETGREGERLGALCDYVKALHPMDHKPTVYICENFACKAPVTEVDMLKMAS